MPIYLGWIYTYGGKFHKWGKLWKLKTSMWKEEGGRWEMTREGERDDREITCPLVISALFIMPSLSSRMSPVRLSVWHWYGSTSLWHKLLLWLVITLLQISCTHPQGMFTCPHMPAFPEASSASLRFWRWPHHLIKICWFSFPAISSLAPIPRILSMSVACRGGQMLDNMFVLDMF